jgi:hypothetical protein
MQNDWIIDDFAAIQKELSGNMIKTINGEKMAVDYFDKPIKPITELEILKEAYIQKFGGYPYPLLRGASDEYITEQIKQALETGQEITAPDNADY